jgi:23S rRNA-intervening sequence protein
MSTKFLNPERSIEMAKKIEKFEDFIAWQKARKLTRDIYRITNLPKFSRDFGLKDQIRRAAVSIMSNLVALDAEYLNDDQFRALMYDANETGQVIGGLRVSVERRKGLT